MNRIHDFLSKQEKQGRPWTKEETKEFKKMNDKTLKEINATLCPPPGRKTGRIAILAPGQIGDMAQATGVLKYMDVLWPGKEIIWFCNAPNADLLCYGPVSEVRPWPWAGFGLGPNEPDHYPYLCLPNNRLNKDLAATRADTADLEDGYFPLTHQVHSSKREGVEYSNVSKQVFGVPMEWDWHPYLCSSGVERMAAKEFMAKLPGGRRTILLETFAGSGQSPFYTADTTRMIMRVCREILGGVNFVFCSKSHIGGPDNCGVPNEQFFDGDPGCVSAGHFTVRQVALLNEYADLMVGISSGVSVATSALGLKPTPKIQWAGSKICSTSAIANGRFELITTDFKTRENSTLEFENKLREILTII